MALFNLNPYHIYHVKSSRPVIIWLAFVSLLIVAMVIVGGATRLTDSGLSITEWKPLLGAIPPLSTHDWLEAFEKYKQIPEYQLVNKGMTLEEFQLIYWWEWAHRFLGRIIGIAYGVPFLFFLIKGYFSNELKIILSVILFLGAIQGYMGWYMVQSGLVDQVDVSHYRLAAHLTLAAIILASCVFIATRLRIHQTHNISFTEGQIFSNSLIILCMIQIISGALVAGLDAGLVYNTWPLMDGVLFPFSNLAMDGIGIFFQDHFSIQFIHRMLAYILAIAVFLYVYWRWEQGVFTRAVSLIFLITLLQISLGILTLIHVVPLNLALLHQLGAFLLLVSLVTHRASFYTI